jgi:hypothetical protein
VETGDAGEWHVDLSRSPDWFFLEIREKRIDIR